MKLVIDLKVPKSSKNKLTIAMQSRCIISQSGGLTWLCELNPQNLLIIYAISNELKTTS